MKERVGKQRCMCSKEMKNNNAGNYIKIKHGLIKAIDDDGNLDMATLERLCSQSCLEMTNL